MTEQRRYVRGIGGRLVDADGRSVIDLTSGWGPVILGHSNQAVATAVAERVQMGILLPGPSAIQGCLEERLRALYPSMDVVHFNKTGSEAVASAVRLARAFTEHKHIVRAGFHGWHDGFISPNYDWHNLDGEIGHPKPVPGTVYGKGDFSAWSGSNAKTLVEHLDRQGANVAALIIDPIRIKSNFSQEMAQIREILHRYGALLIIDEVKTGFRLGVKGFCGRYDVKPDIVVLGKAIANGFPLAACLAGQWAKRLLHAVKLKGTYNHELISLTASKVTLDEIELGNVPVHIENLGKYFESAFRSRLLASNIISSRINHPEIHFKIEPFRWACMPYLKIEPALSKSQAIALAAEIEHAGLVFLLGHMNFINGAHTVEDVELASGRLTKAIEGFLRSEAGDQWRRTCAA